MKTIKGFHSNVTNRTPKQRLAFFRALNPDWRKARANMSSPDTPALSQGFNTSFGKKKHIWMTFDGPQFRYEIDAHKVEGVRMDHTGWYTDPVCSGLCVGIVAMLTHERFITGYRLTDTDERVYFDVIYCDEGGAANAADSEAKEYAEKEMEYQERWNAAKALEYEAEKCLKNIQMMFAIRHHAFLRVAAREDLLESLERLREIREDLKDNYGDIE